MITGYTVTGLNFKDSPNSLMVPSKGISHTQYFQSKGVSLEWPDNKPMIEVEGRQNSRIFLPAELVMGNELDVREMLPQVASFSPADRNKAIEVVKAFLQPGTQTSTGGSLLPALGVVLHDARIVAQAKILSAPMLMVKGVQVPQEKAEHWAPMLARANFDVNPSKAVQLNVVVFYHRTIGQDGAMKTYDRIQHMVNSMKTFYRFGQKPLALVEAGDGDAHWGAVTKYFSGKAPDNLFVLDFNKPRTAADPAYPVVKHLLAKSGFLSQFVSFKTCAHDKHRDDRDKKKSDMILQGVARQILQKAGVSVHHAFRLTPKRERA
jgi:hypothetical protein